MSARAEPSASGSPTPSSSIADAAVAIVGGGFSGAALAWRLARLSAAPIAIFEPREDLGRGLAYSATEEVFRVNVPGDRMSLDLEDRPHFLRWWLERGYDRDDPAALAADGKYYPRRRAFGDYLAAQLAPLVASGRIRHLRESVVGASPAPDGAGWRVVGERTTLTARVLTVATSHPPPSLPRALEAVAGAPKLVADALAPGALDGIGRDDRVLIVGSGLTGADAAAALEARGHRGAISMVSRRGLQSRRQSKLWAEPFGEFRAADSWTALSLLQAARRAVAEAQSAGRDWQAALDALRHQAWEIWAKLPVAERIRIVRKLRAFWDAHRFRMAPQVGEALDRLSESGRLRIFAAEPVAARLAPGGGFEVDLRRRRAAAAAAEIFDAVIVTTGPAHARIFDAGGWLGELSAAGLVAPDPTRLGIHVDERGGALSRAGAPVAGLYVAGPLARGAFGELMGLPEVSAYAARLAVSVVEYLGRDGAPPARGA